MRVLVISEDCRRDKDLLKPVIEAMMAAVGKPRAKVIVEPVLGGVSEALKWERIKTILDQYRMINLFLLIIDRDGESNTGRRATLTSLEERSAAELLQGKALLGEHAIEEIEVWVLAGLELPSDWTWRDLRADPHPKEAYFAQFITEYRKMADDAAGRATLAEEAARHFERMCSRCPEDLKRLTDRVRSLV
jgi:hypothetical protein